MSFLVIAKLECAFVAKGTGALGAAAGVGLPSICKSGEYFVSRETMHHAQLNNMQSVVEGAGDHGERRAGLLVERPETEVVTVKICAKSNCRLREQIPRGVALRRQKIVVDAPCCPDESIKNVSWRCNDIFLKPNVAACVGECDSTFIRGFEEAGKRAFGSFQIRSGACLA